jgi:cytochrome c oxidase cbb3-type subunit 1
MITFATIYYLVPRLWGRTRLYSMRLINWHFWTATLGIVLYISSMWVAGIMQGLMWREYGKDGYLVYAFVDVVAAMKPYYLIRAAGGLLYLSGSVIMAWNVYQTIRGRLRDEAPLSATPYDAALDRPLQLQAA